MMEKLLFNAQRNPASRTIDLFIQTQALNAGAQIVTGITMGYEPIDESSYYEPPIRLGETSAQSLMDALWAAGVKPSGGEGHIRALNNHLDDMRKIVFREYE